MSEKPQRSGCRWPMWPHESRPTHEYCGEKRLPGRSYCAKHQAMSIRSSEEPRTRFVPRRQAA